MKYQREELYPLVARLARKYAGAESSSVSYAVAEQLLGAVVYCMEEACRAVPDALTEGTEQPEQLYEIGLRYVTEKTKKALKLYNELLPDFICYGNRCLHDTFIRGMPEFFRRYDAKFAPQETILTLDYPVLQDLSVYSGIDRIALYLECIAQEQRFFRSLPDGYARQVLYRYDVRYRELVENLTEIVWMDLAARGQNGAEASGEKIRTRMEQYCGEDAGLARYLCRASEDLAVRLRLASAAAAFPFE